MTLLSAILCQPHTLARKSRGDFADFFWVFGHMRLITAMAVCGLDLGR